MFANEKLAQGRLEVEKEIKSSHYLTNLQSGMRAVGIGLMTSLFLSPFVPLPVLAIPPIIHGCSTFLYDWFISKTRRDQREILMARKGHYALFSSEQ